MDKSMKEKCLLIVFALALFAVFYNIQLVLGLLRQVGSIIFPVVLGLVLAFVLNVPMNGFSKKMVRLAERMGRHPGQKAVNMVSLLLTVICIILVIFIAGWLLVPELINSVNSAYDMFRDKWPQLSVLLQKYDVDTDYITTWLAGFNAETLIKNIVNGAGSVANHVVDVASTTVTGVVSAGVAIVVSIYVLLSKITLGRHCRKICYAYLKKSTADRIFHVAGLLRDTYARFLSGQCVEAIILGLLILIAFTIFRLPYAGITAMLTSICAFIPYIGAFCACGIGALLTLLAEPSKVIVCIIVYLVVQFIENQFIYPNVVGSSVGLSPLWTLIAVFIGGKLFGLLGMILFIPLAAVLYTLVREDANRRLELKARDSR
ncbi:MAG: AI-2E family transporter [Firmicutes bacterium]|nr:AI-2E family transporter [Bacillota bacterium]